jgi:hypothetical protein
MAKSENELAELEAKLNAQSEELQKQREELEIEEKKLVANHKEFDEYMKSQKNKFEEHVEKTGQQMMRKMGTGITSQPQSAFRDASKEKRDEESKLLEKSATKNKD